MTMQEMTWHDTKQNKEKKAINSIACSTANQRKA